MATTDPNPASAEEQKKDPDITKQAPQIESETSKNTEDPTGFSESYWNEKRSLLREKYPELLDADLDYNADQHIEFMDNLSTKLGKSPGEINNFLDSI